MSSCASVLAVYAPQYGDEESLDVMSLRDDSALVNPTLRIYTQYRCGLMPVDENAVRDGQFAPPSID
jgi:hypothetical protein